MINNYCIVKSMIIKFIFNMNIFQSPWNKLHSDPVQILAANLKPSCSSEFNDRYCSSIKYCQNKANSSLGETPVSVFKSPQAENDKSKNYIKLLEKTCTIESMRQKANQGLSGYIEKINKSTFYFGEDNESSPTMLQEFHQKISTNPYRILNAPKLKDDFYTNLLDWSSEDIVSVVLDNAAYIWSSKENETEKLIEGFISSIKWGKGLIIGEETGKIRVIDIEKKREVAKNKCHQSRIGVLDTLEGTQGNLILSGSKDNSIMVWDIRTKLIVNKFFGHRQEICGVKWSFDGNMIASGGNDNVVAVWDHRANRLYHRFTQHKAAVKALAWSPHQNSLLVSGGGSTDRTIKFWNITEQKCINQISSGSQVCNLMFSTNSNELVSTHGFSLNEVNIWDAKKMKKVASLTGHSFRVLYLAKSPDGEAILTGSGDQTLRFWKAFPRSGGFKKSSSELEEKNAFIR